MSQFTQEKETKRYEKEVEACNLSAVCFIFVNRNQSSLLFSIKLCYNSLLTPEKSNGSQFADVCWKENGIGSGPSPPTYPRQNDASSFRLVDVLPADIAGEKAFADPARAAAAATINIFDFVMVEFRSVVVLYCEKSEDVVSSRVFLVLHSRF